MIVLIFQAEGGGWWWWWKVPTTVDMMLKCVHFRSFCESSCNSSYVRILSTADLSDYAQSLIPIIFWLVVWKCLEHFLFFHTLGIIIPTGELGRSTTNQFNIPIVPFAVFPPCHFLELHGMIGTKPPMAFSNPHFVVKRPWKRQCSMRRFPSIPLISKQVYQVLHKLPIGTINSHEFTINSHEFPWIPPCSRLKKTMSNG